MAVRVYADLVRPADSRLARVFDVALVAGFSLLIALSAQIAIPLPFTPVPVTLQTFAVILTGCLLGSGRGALAALAYLAEGSAGLPFFSGGTAGVSHLLGPTGGYLVGLVAAAFLAGVLAERGLARGWAGRLATLIAADLVVFLFGVTWLGAFTRDLFRSVMLGFVPFVIGDALKIAVAWGVLEGVSLAARRRETA